ncbi:MAG: carbon starvation CstA 5TM domain-containing protein [Verrucomicrobiia bacterium]
MLTEGFLATLTILACVAGLGLGLRLADGTVLVGEDAWAHQYRTWGQAQGLSATIGAFVNGSGNFLASLGISTHFATALMGVFVASFAATTMDTSCRLQRYVLQELGRSWVTKKSLSEREQTGAHAAAILAVGSAALLAAIPASGEAWSLSNAGKGGMMLWPIFGATNQLVAGIAFIVIVFWVRAAGKPVWFLLPAMLFMLVMPLCALIIQIFFGSGGTPSWMASGNWPLVTLGVTAIVLESWLMVEATAAWRRAGRFSAPSQSH